MGASRLPIQKVLNYVVFLSLKQNLNIPALGLEGTNFTGPICLSWKTLRTSSQVVGSPNVNAAQHANTKTQLIFPISAILKPR